MAYYPRLAEEPESHWLARLLQSGSARKRIGTKMAEEVQAAESEIDYLKRRLVLIASLLALISALDQVLSARLRDIFCQKACGN